MYYVYILVSLVDSSLYTGQCQNVRLRLKKHNSRQVISTRRKVPWRLGYFECFDTRREAMSRESEFKKRWNTPRKKKLIADFDQSLIRRLLSLQGNKLPNS